MALVIGCCDLPGCGGPSSAEKAVEPGHRVNMDDMLAEAKAKLKVSKTARKSKKTAVIEFPSRALD